MTDQDTWAGSDESGPPKKKRRWIPILVGSLILCVFLAIGAIAVTVSWFRNNLVVSESSEDTAMKQFEEIRGRFAGQEPLMQMIDDRPQFVPERANRSPQPGNLNAMHILAYDRDEGKVMTFSLPFWLLRMKSGPIRISAYQQGWDDHGVAFRIQDIEKFGPGIVADVTERKQGRVLIWTE